MKKINLNLVITDFQGNSVKTQSLNSQTKQWESSDCTIKSELIENLSNAFGLDFNKNNELKLKVYDLADKISKSDEILFTKEDKDIIKKVIENLSIVKFGFITKNLELL